jgi:hypothetical protein
VKPHLEPYTSERGLLYMPDVPGSQRDMVGVHASSLATYGPHIWLRATETIHDDSAGVDYDRWVSVHLTTEAATQVAEQLKYLVKHHHLNSRRAWPLRAGGWLQAFSLDVLWALRRRYDAVRAHRNVEGSDE